ncbi:glycosyltransferase family protein [Desulfogranum mediterraneum]|uniref:hypothetical protein n=1 Tax=Desulfogranum mediterraneum TaxID=160661 RepID=UPI001ABF78FA|nr:hypothetical protein [Desulfogranum mediterraneum]
MNKDIAEIHYSYWSRLPCACPKVVVLHDMWSDLMWEGVRRESAELALADLIVTVSIEDRDKLIQRGMKNVHWSPPRVKPLECADASEVCVVASGNHHNVEGLEWLKSSTEKMPTQVHCYGSISDYVGDDDRFLSEGNYAASSEPYEKCGIVLMLTSSGTGVQIKGVEALAHGRVIIARKGAMRGLPSGEIGWVEVDSPDEMVDVLKKAYRDRQYREKMSLASKEYYKKYLESEVVDRRLLEKYRELL